MLRTIRRPTVLFALSLCMGLALTTAASSTAQASSSCKSLKVDGGVLSGLKVSGAGCTTARGVQGAFNACIIKRPALLPCGQRVLDDLLRESQLPSYRCRVTDALRTGRSATGRVTCTRSKKTVRYSYDLRAGRIRG